MTTKEKNTIVLNTGREAFEVITNGETKRWEYDVIELKLAAEELERLHGMRIDDNPEVKRPTIEFMRAFAKFLNDSGLEGCSSDLAFRVYNVVNTQFLTIAGELETQVNAIVKV